MGHLGIATIESPPYGHSPSEPCYRCYSLTLLLLLNLFRSWHVDVRHLIYEGQRLKGGGGM
jgi:hypothetical protein